MSDDINNKTKLSRQRSYLSKDFEGFRSELLSYAKTFFPDQIEDFSEASLGGLLMDMAAFVGDNLSYYLDHQFMELNSETAIEKRNIERHLKAAGIKRFGASPSSAVVEFFIEVQSASVNGRIEPRETDLPIIKKHTKVGTSGGVNFLLTEDLDFSERDELGNLKLKIVSSNRVESASPSSFIVSKEGLCVSGDLALEKFKISNVHVPFRTINLSKSNVTEIISVTDLEGNIYYEVPTLTHDIVFDSVLNLNEDNELVPCNLVLKPAPFRFTSEMNMSTGLTTLRFGSGDGKTLEDDLIPDPSELALPLYGKKTFSKFSIDPGNLLKTKTMGVSPKNTTIKVQYRYGGGLNHNVGARSINSIKQLKIVFPRRAASANIVRSTLDVRNHFPASGGESPPSLSDLKTMIPSYRNSQMRVVTKQDLMARVYTMPSSFGRVFRAGIRPSSSNPLASEMFIITRNNMGKLATAPDSLKKNLRIYLNEFRLTSDAIDILDASVINISISFSVLIDPTQNQSLVLQTAIKKVRNYFNIKHFHIDQPIMKSEVMNLLINTMGVLSIVDLTFFNKSGNSGGYSYSSVSFNIVANDKKGIIFGPPGSIFEMRHPSVDIIAKAV